MENRVEQMRKVQEEAKNSDSHNFEGNDAIENFFFTLMILKYLLKQLIN